MLTPVGIQNLEKKTEGNYVLQYKKQGGCIKYTKNFSNPLKLLKCIRLLEKSRKYTFNIFEVIS